MKQKNRTLVKVKGLNQERALNNITKHIKIYNFKREKQNTCQFEVDYNERKQIKALIEREGLEILSISHRGVLSWAKKILTSYGLIVGIAICGLFYPLQYGFILKIDVFGANNLEKDEIIAFVDENLVSRYKGKIDTDGIEILVKENFEEVSSISVAIVGQTLVINVNEAVLPDEMKDEFPTIISQYDGLITDINLVQGTLAVDVGDIVKKGDVLVYPYIIDSQGEERKVKPQADIIADVWISATEVYYDYYIERVRTGRSMTVSETYLSKLLIYSNGGSVPYEKYEVVESEKTLTKNLILPFYVKKKVYYELTTREIVQDFNLDKEKVIEKARQNALIFLQENEIIKEENFLIKEFGGVHQVEYLITVNRNIGG